MTLRQYIKKVNHEMRHWPAWKREFTGVKKCNCTKLAAQSAGKGVE